MVRQKIVKIVGAAYREATVEPLLFLATIATALLVTGSKALIYRKVCISHYDPDLCDNVDNGSFPEQEQHVQSEASFWYLAEMYFHEVPSLMASFCYGSLSDKYGRSVALILPLAGQIISSVIYIVNAVFEHMSLAAILPGPLISGLLGGSTSISIGAFSLLGDITSPQQRTTRMSIAESGVFISSAIGHGFSGYILDKTSFMNVFVMAGGLYFMSLAYVLLWIKEGRPVKPKSGSYCDMSMLSGSFLVLLKNRPDRKRTYIFIILLSIFLVIISNIGKQGICLIKWNLWVKW